MKNIEYPAVDEIDDIPPLERRRVVLDAEYAELLAQALERQLDPIVKDIIRDAVRDSARRMARDMRKRLDAELSLMIREAVDAATHPKR